MPNRKGPLTGHIYRFVFGSESSAVNVMCEVHVPGPIDMQKAVVVAKKTLKANIGKNGIDFDCLNRVHAGTGLTIVGSGRIYAYEWLVDIDDIVEVRPAKVT